MIKPILAALVAAVIPTTAAAGIHDFDPSNLPNRTASASIQGNCYQTRDQSRYCYMATGNGTYSIAIRDVDDPSYPQVMTVNCNTGIYRSWGALNKSQLDIWASAFCSQM